MKSLLLRLWKDESGALLSCELIFLGAILVIGLIPGIVCIRDAICTEMCDFAACIEEIDCGWWHGPPGNRPPGNRPPGNRPPGNRPPHHGHGNDNGNDNRPLTLDQVIGGEGSTS